MTGVLWPRHEKRHVALLRLHLNRPIEIQTEIRRFRARCFCFASFCYGGVIEFEHSLVLLSFAQVKSEKRTDVITSGCRVSCQYFICCVSLYQAWNRLPSYHHDRIIFRVMMLNMLKFGCLYNYYEIKLCCMLQNGCLRT